MTSMVESIWMERVGPVAVIRFNRPAALNAVDRLLATQFLALLQAADRDPAVGAVLVTGEGRAFSAGHDVHELASDERRDGPVAVTETLRKSYNPVVLQMRSMGTPVIAAVNGVVTGAGLGFALAADIRIASDAASFVISPVRLGLIPAVGGTTLLPAIIGLGQATQLAFTGERVDARRALEIGLVTRVVPADDLMAVALAEAERIAAQPRVAIALTKQAFNAAALPNLADQLDLEAALQGEAASQPIHQERLAQLIAPKEMA